jgi:hypothetical protein
MIQTLAHRLRRSRNRLHPPPAVPPYGKVAVFLDLYGNKWDLVEFG